MTATGNEPTTPADASGHLPIAPLAESGLLARLGDRIDEELVGRVLALADALADAALPGVVDVVPSYTTLMVIFDPERTDGEAVA
ncbi:MAG TPA: carboxyltransferase domain-containing protein, partial [Thermomicrobiales bacterium]|nr:carboxyltransferase domain-containing protein [Thermomicrobiales bacterium]